MQTLCDPVDCSPPGSSVLGISQARILEGVATSFSRGSSRPRDRTRTSCISCLSRWVLCHQHHPGSPSQLPQVFTGLPWSGQHGASHLWGHNRILRYTVCLQGVHCRLEEGWPCIAHVLWQNVYSKTSPVRLSRVWGEKEISESRTPRESIPRWRPLASAWRKYCGKPRPPHQLYLRTMICFVLFCFFL